MGISSSEREKQEQEKRENELASYAQKFNKAINTKPIKEEEPQSKFIRRRIIQKESKPEEVCEDEIYKIVNIVRKYNPKTKVVKNLKGKEEDILEDKIIYEKKEEPQIKRIRKKVIIKNGKEEEVEEDPGKNVIYKVVKYGKENDPQTKIKRIRTITKFNKDRENEEDIPGDELIIKTIKQEPNKEIKKIIIKKDGQIQETEEELPQEEEKIKQDEGPKTIKIGQEKAPQIIQKKIIPKNIIAPEQKEEKLVEESLKKEEKEEDLFYIRVIIMKGNL